MNIDDPKKIEVIKNAVHQAAMNLHAKAVLVCGDGIPPKLVVWGEDFLHGRQEIIR
jgi:hypothetical protein